MRVGLDAVFVEPGCTGGMEVYARQLAAALARQADLTVFTSRTGSGGDWPVEPVVLPVQAAGRVRQVLAQQALLPRAASARGLDVLHGLGNTVALGGEAWRRVVTVHDLHHRRHRGAHSTVRAHALRVLVAASVRRSHRVLVPSVATREEVTSVLRVPAHRVDVVPPGPGRPPRPGAAEPEVRRALDLGARDVLVAPVPRRAHKNVPRLVRALALLPPPRPLLVLTGYRSPSDAAVAEEARSLGVDTRLTGWLADDVFDGLLRLATAVVVPSTAEGYGLPVVEAMERGVPVVCGSGGGLAEAAGGAARIVDVGDEQDLARGLADVLHDAGLRSRLVTAGRERVARWSWDDAASATLEAYRRTLA